MKPDALRALVQGGYDRLADRYAETFWTELDRKPFDRAWLDGFLGTLAGPGPLVDLGCGPGQIGRYLSEGAAGRRVVGLDLSPAMVRRAQALSPAMSFACGDLLALPFAPASLAGAVAFYSLIHLLRADVPRALAGMRRALAPGAPLLVSAHGGDGHVAVESMLGEPVPMYATLFAEGELPELVAAAGFTVRRAVTRPPYEFEYASPRLYVSAVTP